MKSVSSPNHHVEVALFPIPNLVSFPSTKVPLHIFEPRFRVLIKECVRAKRRVGVCHVKKVIKEAPPGQTSSERLSSNQDFYEPHKVFSAGFCEILDITDDGRLYAEVNMDGRFSVVKTIQDLPYKIAVCEVFEDTSPCDSDGQKMKEAIDQELLSRSGADKALQELLVSPAWKAHSPEAYSLAVFQILKFEAQWMQKMLECQEPSERLRFALETLRATKDI